jgi:hypothetical protein
MVFLFDRDNKVTRMVNPTAIKAIGTVFVIASRLNPRGKPITHSDGNEVPVGVIVLGEEPGGWALHRFG